MPRKVLGPSRLSKVMAQLNKAPRPQLVGLQSLKLTLAFRNDHWGARHFLKEDLPRIRYANPKLDIQVTRKIKTKEETWDPELVLQFKDGVTKSVPLQGKWSSKIFQEVMETAGGATWARWKTERAAAGLPIVDEPPVRARPSLSKTSASASAAPVPSPSAPDPLKTGAAAVLP
ncbi:hypothetical protein FA95DRAFT_1608845 [Auriscalpium vulgare]|uniref:Uncharacterized protein n=1 Tax=Auriscalpium vulgare TaxID=40419 RepID=A0ACB8RIR6_9AGAM|nr:hypothetical protein FA95DRAFT_1608845 [Auriscalpium vulgare]